MQLSEASSSGHAAHKIKSIDVHANLLSQRLAEREMLGRSVRRKLLAILVALGISSAILPFLYTRALAISTKAGIAEQENTKLKSELAKVREAAKLVQPRIKSHEMVAKCRTYASAFFGQVVRLMNAPSGQVALTSLRADVIGGDVKLLVKADAEDFASAEEFLRQARAGGSPEDAGFTWTRRSDVLKKGGVSFELAKKATIGE